ncbi:MAG: hypothetical protein U1E76_08610 [Planctomycetota bacterium]
MLPISGPGECATEPREALNDVQREGVMRFLRDVRPSPRDLLCVGYPGLAVFQRVLSLPPVPEHRIDETVAFELNQLRPFDTEDLLVRRRILARSHRATELRTMVAATPRQQVLVIGEDLRKLGMRVDLLEPETIALANFLDWERPAPLPCMALQIGRMRTDLVFLAPHFVFTRAFPYGAGAILKDAPEPPQVDDLARRLVRDLRAALGAAFGDANALAGDRLFLLGAGASCQVLVASLGEQLGLAAEPLRELRRLHLHPRLQRSHSVAAVARMGSAIGLALAGFDAGQLGLPLVPISEARRARSLAPMTAGAALVASGLLVLLTSHEVRQKRIYEAALADASPERSASLHQQALGLDARLQAARAQVDLLERTATAPSLMLRQMQSLIEAMAKELPECRLLHFSCGALRPRPSSPARPAAP